MNGIRREKWSSKNALFVEEKQKSLFLDPATITGKVISSQGVSVVALLFAGVSIKVSRQMKFHLMKLMADIKRQLNGITEWFLLEKEKDEKMGDVIYRQAAIDAIRKDVMGGLNYESILKRLPSAEPEQKTGRWERHYSRPGVFADLFWHCSCCGYKNGNQYADVYHKFCPNCGARMKGAV